MGYRSDVVFAIAFGSEEIRDEIMAIYTMHPDVQKLPPEFLKTWKKATNDDTPMLVFAVNYIKWYSTHYDVVAIQEIMPKTIEMFGKERQGHSIAAWSMVRVGEENDDIETETGWANAASDELANLLYDTVFPTVRIETHYEIEEVSEQEETT